MTSPRPFILSVAGRELNGLVSTATPDRRLPTIVVCHGFKGFMEWGFFPSLADLLTARGFCVVRFNFSGAGMKPGDDLVTDLAAFRDATFSRDLDELSAVLGALATEIAPRSVDDSRIGLVGHSRGGGVALLAAASDLPIRALVTWAAVSTFDRFPPAEHETWRTAGSLPIVNARTGQQLEIGTAVLDDLERHRVKLDLEAAAGARRMPWLIVHGDADETVPIREARQLAAAASPPTEVLEIAGTDHTFGAKHPFGGPNPALTTAMNATQGFLHRHLRLAEST